MQDLIILSPSSAEPCFTELVQVTLCSFYTLRMRIWNRMERQCFFSSPLLHVCFFAFHTKCLGLIWQLWLVNANYPMPPLAAKYADALPLFIRLSHMGCHCNSKMRLCWVGEAKMFHSSVTVPEASLCPIATDSRIDWKTVECVTLTARPPPVGITPRYTAVKWSDASGVVVLLWNDFAAPAQQSLVLEFQSCSMWKRQITALC